MPARVTGLDHVQLAAPPECEQAARAFFGGLLGLEELEKPAALRGRGGVWFALPDGRQLHVGVEPDFAPASRAHPAFLVEGYDALRAHFGDAAVDDDSIPGRRRFYAADPWGNRLEFVAVPSQGLSLGHGRSGPVWGTVPVTEQ